MKDVDAARIILGEAGTGDQFTIRWGWLRLKLSIKPVTTRTLIQISGEVAHVPEIDPEADMLPEMLRAAPSLNHVCKAITYATKTRHKRIVYRAIKGLPLKDIAKLWQMIMNQSDPASFFFIMISTRGQNKTKTTTTTKAQEKQ
jgi:hypothetical protein